MQDSTMGFALIKPVYEPDYLSLEETSAVKHEFVGNRIYAMAGASERHNTIAGNLFAACHGAQRGVCRPFIGDMRLRLDGGAAYYYPDVMLVCDPRDDHPMYKASPCMIAEVMSPSTEALDRREKLVAYQKLPMLREVLLIAQDQASVEFYQRVSPDQWGMTTLGLADTVEFSCVPLKLTVRDLYRGLEFPAPAGA